MQKKTFRNVLTYIGISFALFVALLLSALHQPVAASSSLEKIYHIYIDQQYIGKTLNEHLVTEVQDQMIDQVAKDFDRNAISLKNEISQVTETVFNLQSFEGLTADKMQQSLDIQVEGLQLMVNDQKKVIVKDNQAFEQIKEQVKKKHVSEEEWAALQADQPAEIETGKWFIQSVDFSQEWKTEAVVASPEEFSTVEEAVKELTEGKVATTYTVESGDTWDSIAEMHEIKVATLQELNPGQTEVSVGQELILKPAQEAVQVQVKYATKQTVEIPFEKEEKKDSTLLKGEDKVVQEGQKGEAVETLEVVKVNGQEQSKTVTHQEITKEVKNEITAVGTKTIPSRGTGSFGWPAVGGYVSSTMGYRWGRMHEGIDIARPSNPSILASDNGTVIKTGYNGGLGNHVVIRHNNGYETLYGHLSSIQVRSGQVVSKGQKLGNMGRTGNSTGVHLHFEVRKNGSLINPLSVLR